MLSKGRRALGRAGNLHMDTPYAWVFSFYITSYQPIAMLAVPVTAGEKSWLLRNQRQNSHWLLSGSDFTRVDENSGSSERATYNTAPVPASTITISSSGIFLQNFLGMQEGLHRHPALRAGSTGLLEDASYLLSDLLRGIVKQDVVKSILFYSRKQ